MTRNLGLMLLAIWLILWGAFALISVGQVGVVILAILAIIAGILILIGR